jgi:cell division protein FtsI (penicillin-binding protein 3)
MGFGLKTGLELPGEAFGKYSPETPWTARSLPSVSIGYEISVTAVQVLRAMNIVANRGLSVPPRIVARGAGRDAASPAVSAERVLSPEAAERLASILARSVEEGTGIEAGVPGYAVAGKTGTAQKFDQAQRAYARDRHLASFAGFVPADKPVLSVVVFIDEPQGVYYGGQVAAPVFRAVAGQVLRYLKIPPAAPASRSVIAAELAPGGAE